MKGKHVFFINLLLELASSRIFDWTEILRLCHLLFIEIEMFCNNELVNNAKFPDTIPG